jgi:hypothetical protein
VNCAPPPADAEASTLPPIAATSSRTIASPSPEPTGRSLRRVRRPASLSQLSAGQRVGVLQAPNHTLVIARDARP